MLVNLKFNPIEQIYLLMKSRVRSKSSTPPPQSSTNSQFPTAKQMFYEVQRRIKNHQDNMLTSSKEYAQPVHKISDNLDSTRGKSSSQIKKMIFGDNRLPNDSDLSKALQFILSQFGIRSQQKKGSYHIIKHTPRTQQQDKRQISKHYLKLCLKNQREKRKAEQRKKQYQEKLRRSMPGSPNPSIFKLSHQIINWHQQKRKQLMIQSQWATRKPASSHSSPITKRLKQLGQLAQKLHDQVMDQNKAVQIRRTVRGSPVNNQQQENTQDLSQYQQLKMGKHISFQQGLQYNTYMEQSTFIDATRPKTQRSRRSSNHKRQNYALWGTPNSQRKKSNRTLHDHPVVEIYKQTVDQVLKRKKNNDKDFLRQMKPFGTFQDFQS